LIDSMKSTEVKDLRTFINESPTQVDGIKHEIEWYVRNGWAEPTDPSRIDC
jgi:hypothetical protein